MDVLLPESLLNSTQSYLELLDRWNRTHALTSLPEGERFEELILDACALLPHLGFLGTRARIVDFGSGMGIPSVVLALARPDLEIVALDKSRKKVAFVRQVALELELKNLRAIAARAEELEPLEAQMGVAKAVGSPKLLSEWWERHGRSGAPFLALKSDTWVQETLPGQEWALVSHPYHLPTRGQRVILEMRKRTGP